MGRQSFVIVVFVSCFVRVSPTHTMTHMSSRGLKRISEAVPTAMVRTPPSTKRLRKVPPIAVTPDNHRSVSTRFETWESGSYIDLCVPPNELRPSATLTNGQCFHWMAMDPPDDDVRKTSAWGSHNATEWVGTLRAPTGESVVVAIRETNDSTLYRKIDGPEIDCGTFLRNYFQLDQSLEDLYEEWSQNCPRMKKIAVSLPGVRIIDQDPWECLVSFICSSNNNIPRITKMLKSLRQTYGQRLVTIGDDELYSFPSLDDLASAATEINLRTKCGMGYRAKYILETIRKLKELGGEKYLWELRASNDPIGVQEKLCEFHGVGRKVADCVALFSLKQENAVPVDVHVWNIARRDYDNDGTLAAVKSLTPSVYRAVGDLFRDRFQAKSGWAHSLLFVAELPSFRPALPQSLVEEMDRFKEVEKKRKQTEKETRKLSKQTH